MLLLHSVVLQAFTDLVHARARRRMSRGLKRKPMAFIKRLRKAKKSESLRFLAALPPAKPAMMQRVYSINKLGAGSVAYLAVVL